MGSLKDSIQYFILNEFYRSMISDNFRIRNSLPRRQPRLPSSSYPSQPLLFPLVVFAPFSVSSSPRKRQTNDKVNRQEWEKQFNNAIGGLVSVTKRNRMRAGRMGEARLNMQNEELFRSPASCSGDKAKKSKRNLLNFYLKFIVVSCKSPCS